MKEEDQGFVLYPLIWNMTTAVYKKMNEISI